MGHYKIMKQCILILRLCLFACLLSFDGAKPLLAQNLNTPQSTSGTSQPLSCQNIAERITLAQTWIMNAQRSDGLFIYEYLPLEDKFTDDDNIVRQVGTFWALTESLSYARNAETLAVISKFRDKIGRMIIRAKAKEENKSTDIAYIDFNGIGKLNTSALYVLSLLSLKNHNVPLTQQEEKDLPLFIEGLRKMSDEKGGFWYLYYLPKKDNKITSYGSGEALFALAKYYDHTNDIDNLKWVYKAFLKYDERFLKNNPSFQNTEARSFFSWGIYALAVINEKFPIPYETTVKPMLDMAFKAREESPKCQNKGCFFAPSLGEAAFFEGMVQAYKMTQNAEKDKAEVQKLKDFIDLALQYYASLQVTNIEQFRQKSGYTGKTENVLGVFCDGEPCKRIRNDLTQHAMNALIYYHKQICQ